MTMTASTNYFLNAVSRHLSSVALTGSLASMMQASSFAKASEDKSKQARVAPAGMQLAVALTGSRASVTHAVSDMVFEASKQARVAPAGDWSAVALSGSRASIIQTA